MLLLLSGFAEASPKAACPDTVAAAASPRTNCSWCCAPNTVDSWFAHQRNLAKLAEEYENRAHAHKLLLLGDSITEALRGTINGKTGRKRLEGQLAVFQSSALSREFPSPLVLAASGDATQHVLWRLREGGEISPAMATDHHLWINLLVGINNLNSNLTSGVKTPPLAAAAAATADGILTVARMLLSGTKGRLLVNALLPRSRNPCEPKPPPCPHPKVGVGEPADSPWEEAVNRTNALLAGDDGVRALAAAFPGRVRLVDCSALFRPAPPSRELVDFALIDGLHPTPEGSRRMLACIADAMMAWRTEVQKAASASRRSAGMRAGEGVGAITDEAARKADDESGAFSVAELRRQLSGEEPETELS